MPVLLLEALNVNGGIHKGFPPLTAHVKLFSRRDRSGTFDISQCQLIDQLSQVSRTRLPCGIHLKLRIQCLVVPGQQITLLDFPVDLLSHFTFELPGLSSFPSLLRPQCTCCFTKSQRRIPSRVKPINQVAHFPIERY